MTRRNWNYIASNNNDADFKDADDVYFTADGINIGSLGHNTLISNLRVDLDVVLKPGKNPGNLGMTNLTANETFGKVLSVQAGETLDIRTAKTDDFVSIAPLVHSPSVDPETNRIHDVFIQQRTGNDEAYVIMERDLSKVVLNGGEGEDRLTINLKGEATVVRNADGSFTCTDREGRDVRFSEYEHITLGYEYFTVKDLSDITASGTPVNITDISNDKVRPPRG